MKFPAALALWCALISNVIANDVAAATISIIVKGLLPDDAPPGACNIRMTGEVNPGDADKLSAAIDQASDTIEPSDSYSLCLDSPGGDMGEGIKIVKLLLGSRYYTVIEADKECYSACAFIFLAGSSCSKYTCQPSRQMHVSGRLGFHAPYLMVNSGIYAKDIVEHAYNMSTMQIGQILDVLTTPIGLGDKTGRPWAELFIFVETLKKGPNEFFYIDTIGKAGLLGVELFGVEPLPSPNKRMMYDACVNALYWSRNHTAEFDYLKDSNNQTGPSLDGASIKRIEKGQTTMRLTQDVHYIYDLWNQCDFDIHDQYVSVSTDRSPQVRNQAWIMLPGDTLISNLSDRKVLERIARRK